MHWVVYGKLKLTELDIWVEVPVRNSQYTTVQCYCYDASLTNKLCSVVPVLWNRTRGNYFLRFRFWLLKSDGSSSDFRKVMVPVPTFEKLWFQFLLLKSYGSGSGSSSISRPWKANF